MSDSHLHRHLSPQSIRFCPLCGGTLERRAVPPEDKHEMVCAGCSFIFYLNHKVVAATIPEDTDGRILLTRRSIEPGRGKWTFPGGFVDWGEPVDSAALRETWEETGLKVDLDGLLGVYSYAGTPIVIVVYRARVLGGTLTVCHENDRVEWVAPAEIPWGDLAFPSTTEALRAFFTGRGRT
jgi:ADP-ribose pyrophosphatase YjhB (NUDIX family)